MQNVIEQATLEAVGHAEQQEAWFRHLSQDYDGRKQAEVYQHHYLQWLKQPMAAHTAYIQRACMGLQAKCYLQVPQTYTSHCSVETCNSAHFASFQAIQLTGACDAGKMGLPASYQVIAASTSGMLMLLSILKSCLQSSRRLSIHKAACLRKPVPYLQI